MVLGTDEIDEGLADDWQYCPPDPDGTAFLQYTSGTTRSPAGVVISHRNLVVNAVQIAGHAGMSAATVAVSWLPLFHDMGMMFGLVLPLVLGARSVQLSPAAFLYQPARWLRLITDLGGTVTAAPDFAFNLCVDRISAEQRAGLDLSTLQCVVSGAERVRAPTLRRFQESFAGQGFSPSAWAPGFGLAEATLAVTGSVQTDQPRVLAVDRTLIAKGTVRVAADESAAACATEVVSCGPPISGLRMAIVAPDSREPLPEDQVGEVWVHGPSVATGYFRRPDETSRVFGGELSAPDGKRYLRTGDLGFLHGGELYLVGRIKDLIIVDGRNQYPPDLEQTAEQAHPAIRNGGCAVFGIEDSELERIVVVVEVAAEALARDRAATLEDLRAAVRREIAASHEVSVFDVVPVKRGAIPRTTSGKLRRSSCREAYLDGGLITPDAS